MQRNSLVCRVIPKTYVDVDSGEESTRDSISSHSPIKKMQSPKRRFGDVFQIVSPNKRARYETPTHNQTIRSDRPPSVNVNLQNTKVMACWSHLREWIEENDISTVEHLAFSIQADKDRADKIGAVCVILHRKDLRREPYVDTTQPKAVYVLPLNETDDVEGIYLFY